MKIKVKGSFAGLLMVAMMGIWGCGGEAAKESKQDDAGAATEAAIEEATDEESDAGEEAVANGSAQDGLEAFIPEGYEILDTAFGDLNLDAHTDAIMVLKSKEEATAEDFESRPRPVLILTGTADHRWNLEARNDHAALGQHDGGVFGDPWDGITIKDGYFSLEHYGGSNWRWSKIITFKYNPSKGQWFLHRDGGDSYHTSEPDKVTSEVRTVKDFGIVKFDEYKAYDAE